jgi:hypothetical protein
VFSAHPPDPAEKSIFWDFRALPWRDLARPGAVWRGVPGELGEVLARSGEVLARSGEVLARSGEVLARSGEILAEPWRSWRGPGEIWRSPGDPGGDLAVRSSSLAVTPAAKWFGARRSRSRSGAVLSFCVEVDDYRGRNQRFMVTVASQEHEVDLRLFSADELEVIVRR